MQTRPDETDTDLIKLWVKFVPRQGWLPYDCEGLWAEPVDSASARICNAPFLAQGIAVGDVLSYTFDHDAARWATGRVAASGNCTIRVLAVPSGPLGPSV